MTEVVQGSGGLLGMPPPSVNPTWGFWACYAGRRKPKVPEQEKAGVRAGVWAWGCMAESGGQWGGMPVCEGPSWRDSRPRSEQSVPSTRCVTLGPQ